MQMSPFLRTVLKIDGVSCLAMAAIGLPFSAALSAPTGLASMLLGAAAAALVPIGLFILWLGMRAAAPAGLVGLVVAGNIGWAAASMFVALGSPGITALGQLLVIGQAVAVVGMALLEWAGLQSSRNTAVSG